LSALQEGRWFSLGTPVSSTNKTDCHDITEILLKVALNTITLTQDLDFDCWIFLSSSRNNICAYLFFILFLLFSHHDITEILLKVALNTITILIIKILMISLFKD
jgi:hypothetical protein